MRLARVGAAAVARLRAAMLATLLALGAGMTAGPAQAADDGVTDYVTITSGSYIIDTGSLSPTVANSLRPYGVLFDLIRNQQVPVLWAINPGKLKDGADFIDPSNGKSYRAGPFIIRSDFVTPGVLAVINNWRARGVAIDGPIVADIPGVPIYDTISGIANLVLDTDNGSIAAGYMSAAGIPSTAYRYGSPAILNSCDDMFVMPHADPTWSTHSNLIPFVQSRGYVWSACHAVSVLENIDNPATVSTNPDMNFLSIAGLVPYGSHGDGSLPYTTASPGDPAMQYIGTTDAAQRGGSEQIYLPRLQLLAGLPVGGWRPGANLVVIDPTQADVPTLSPGPAAAIVYGRAFDNASYGRVMYEGGHSHAGTAPANIAAQRAFLNFWLLALIERSPDVAISGGGIVAVSEGGSMTLTASVNHPFPIVGYQWTSSGGGTFSSPNSAATKFTPPEAAADTPIVIRVTVTDGCNRAAYDAYQIVVNNVEKADLSITKVDSKDPVAPGETFNYQLSVGNQGTETATGVLVEDVLPAGLGFVGAAGTGWTCSYDPGTRKVSCARASLPLTGSTPSTITLTVTATAASGVITNTATVSSSLPDLAPSNNSASQTTTVVSGVDVAVTKTAPAAPVYAGAPFDYLLNVRNESAVSATSLTVNDLLPDSLAFVSASGAGWDCVYQPADRRVNCFLPSLAFGASSTISLRVVPTGSAGQVIANTATVSSPDFSDADPADNTATANVTLSAPADLALAKTGSTTGGGGSQVDTWVVTLSNRGPGTAVGIVVTDTMSGSHVGRYSSGCTVTPSTGTVAPASPWPQATLVAGGTWSIASLATGASATLTMTCAGDNNDGVVNNATVTSQSFDPEPANDLASAFVVDGSTTVTDLQLTKTGTPATALTGAPVTYRITVDNLGSVDATGTITVTDKLPAGSVYVGFANVSGGGSWSCSQAAEVVTCLTSTDLKRAGSSPSSLYFDLTATTPPVAGTIINSATVSYDWGNDRYDPPANNTASATTTVVHATTDIAVTKTVDSPLAAQGASVVFTATASNVGPAAASNLRVADVLPEGLTFVSVVLSQGSYDPATGLWYVGRLANGAAATLTLTATVAQPSGHTNRACLYALDQADSNPGNDCGEATVSPPYADLALAKTASTPTPGQGQNFGFTITLSNLGPTAASAITVTEQLPADLRYVSHTASTGAYDPASGLWSIPGPLANGATATLSIVATVASAGVPVTNTASITASSVPDPVASNDVASVTVTGRAANIEVSKAVDVAAPVALNTPLTFTVTARNLGPSDAATLTIEDVLPAGLLHSSHTASQGGYLPDTGQWTVGPLADGASATLTIVATNTQFGLLVNSARRAESAPADPDDTNDVASVQVLSGGSADLTVTKVVDKPSTYQGDTVTFTIQVENEGPDTASGVRIRDSLPAGLEYVSHAASQGTYLPTTGTWTVGDLLLSQRVTLTMVARVTGVGDLLNQASVDSLHQGDPDAANEPGNAIVTSSPAADLSVTKTAPPSVALGGAVVYTIVAANAGPAAVSGATLVDTVPPQVVVGSWTCVATGAADCDTASAGTGGAGSGNSIALPNLQISAGPGNFVTVTVHGIAASPGVVTNTVSISPPGDSTIFDPEISNNIAAATTVVSLSRLAGRVFADTGTGGGVANDGIRNGGEIGIANVTVRLTDCGSTTYASASTDGAGHYAIGIPLSIPAGATLCAVQTNLSGYLSTGAQAGNIAGSYDRVADAVRFVLSGDASYSGVDFGDVPENRLLTDGARTALPATTVSYPHTYVAATAGVVSFSLGSVPSPAVDGWTQLLYRDSNCDGVLNAPADTPLSSPVAVTEGEKLCLLVQQFVPAALAQGSSNLVTVQASFSYANASPTLAATATRTDTTTVSDTALLLAKEVRNLTQNGAWGTSNAARPGEVIEYRITFTNTGVAPLNELVVNDMTPTFTTFVSAACGVPLPAGLAACTISHPAYLAAGAVRWQFEGTLGSALSGVVTYQVKVQ